MKTDGQLTTAVVTLANRHKGKYRCRLHLTSIVALANTRKRATEVPVRFNISVALAKGKWEIQVTCRLDLTSIVALAKRNNGKYR